jgi:hypothetical protein
LHFAGSRCCRSVAVLLLLLVLPPRRVVCRSSEQARASEAERGTQSKSTSPSDVSELVFRWSFCADRRALTSQKWRFPAHEAATACGTAPLAVRLTRRRRTHYILPSVTRNASMIVVSIGNPYAKGTSDEHCTCLFSITVLCYKSCTPRTPSRGSFTRRRRACGRPRAGRRTAPRRGSTAPPPAPERERREAGTEVGPCIPVGIQLY